MAAGQWRWQTRRAAACVGRHLETKNDMRLPGSRQLRVVVLVGPGNWFPSATNVLVVVVLVPGVVFIRQFYTQSLNPPWFTNTV